MVDSRSFDETLATLTDQLGFRLDLIRPADEPAFAALSRGDIVVHVASSDDGLDRGATELPELRPELVLTTEDGDSSWVSGRAGMRYRDLIPGRLGGRFIASNIEVCDGGPVPDLVHHHGIRFQLIVCQRGWVDVVYEDQGPPFRMQEGDAVLQPPHIRHRVLASSAGARVVEVGCPASHDTLFDHELDLPTEGFDPERAWQGQRFVHHRGQDADWVDDRDAEAQITAIADATGGLADVRFLRPRSASPISGQAATDGELHFVCALSGAGRLAVDGRAVAFTTGASVALPPGQSYRLDDLDPDTRLLEVRLPAPH